LKFLNLVFYVYWDTDKKDDLLYWIWHGFNELDADGKVLMLMKMAPPPIKADILDYILQNDYDSKDVPENFQHLIQKPISLFKLINVYLHLRPYTKKRRIIHTANILNYYITWLIQLL